MSVNLINNNLKNYYKLSNDNYKQKLLSSLTSIEASVLKDIINYKINYLLLHKEQWLQELELFNFSNRREHANFIINIKNDSENKLCAKILECKKSSPSQGLINQEFPLIEIAKIYSKDASAISVLTDEKFFSGSFNNLDIVSEVTDKPLLCKDFIIDELQIIYAYKHNASAILLMLQVLNDEALVRLASFAKQLNLSILFEIHNQHELNRLISLKELIDFELIGINNRNLKDLTVDVNNTYELVYQLIDALPDVLIISESGINSYSAVRSLSKVVDGFLVGTSLMRKNNLHNAICKLFMPNIKICGNLDLSFLELQDSNLIKLISYVGFIFVPDSPRYIGNRLDTQLVKLTNYNKQNNINIKPVAVFCNCNISVVLSILIRNNIDIVQLHGLETEEYHNLLYKKYKEMTGKDLVIWQAIFIDNEEDSYVNNKIISKALNTYKVDKLILETKTPHDSKLTGGNGNKFNWQCLSELSIQEKDRLILAGGLSLTNTEEAWSYGLSLYDYNSKVEIKPGIKDYNIIADLLSLVSKQ